MTLRVQLSGVTYEKFNPFRRTTLITWAVLISHIFHVIYYGQSFMHEPTLYLALGVLSFFSLGHFIWCVTTELSDILGINILTMTKEQLARQPELERIEKETQA